MTHLLAPDVAALCHDALPESDELPRVAGSRGTNRHASRKLSGRRRHLGPPDDPPARFDADRGGLDPTAGYRLLHTRQDRATKLLKRNRPLVRISDRETTADVQLASPGSRSLLEGPDQLEHGVERLQVGLDA